MENQLNFQQKSNKKKDTENKPDSPSLSQQSEKESDYTVPLNSGYNLVLNQTPLPRGFNDYHDALLGDYHGVALAREDYEAMMELERLLGEPIPNWDAIDQSGRFAFVHLNARVVKLSLCHQNLKSIPESIGNLVYLTLFDVTNNRLTDLPNSISKLANLENLWCDRNKIQAIPENIFKLISLKSLSLRRNQLAHLPDNFGDLHSLIILNLSKNLLSTLPESIGMLKNLDTLELMGNRLETLPAEIGNLKELKYIRLENNPIRTLPVELLGLPNLKKISIEHSIYNNLPKNQRDALHDVIEISDFN